MAIQFNYMVLVCKDCGEEFVFTASAQEYFESKGLKRVPNECRSCHLESKKRERIATPELKDTDPGIQPP